MIIFLHGEDSFRSRQKLREVINQYKEVRKKSLHLIHVDAREGEFVDFYYHLKISSMFTEKKLVILNHVFSNKRFQEELLKALKTIESLQDAVVIYESEKVDERTKIFKILTKECRSQQFSLLENKQVKGWATREFEKRNQKINNDALELLTTYIGNDLWRFSQEIEKLCNFKQKATIKREDIESLVRQKIDTDIFKTIDALAAKNKKEALSLLQKHIDNGDNVLYLLSMVTYQFRNLLVVKELASKGLMYASIVKRSGLHPFVVKKNYFAASHFSLDELKNIYKKIFQVDIDIKSGRVEPETALDVFVSKI